MPADSNNPFRLSSATLGASQDAATHWQLAWRLIQLAWKFRRRCVQVLVLNLFLLSLALSGLSLVGLGVDVVRHAMSPDTVPAPKYPLGLKPPIDEPMVVVALIAAGVLAVSLVRGLLHYASAMTVSRLIHRDVQIKLRADVYDKLQRLSFRFFDANTSGSIINRVTSDTHAIAQFINGVLLATVQLALTLAIYMAYMLSIHAGLTAACLATTPILVCLSIKFSRTVKPAYRRNRELRDHMVTRLAESVQGMHVVKGFARQQAEIDLFNQANDHVTNQQQWIFHKISIFQPLIGLTTYVNIMVLLVFGGYLVMLNNQDPSRGIPLGTGLFVFAGLLQQFSTQIATSANITNTIQVSLTAAQRVFEILDAPIEIKSTVSAVRLGKARGAVAFENVDFSYDGQNRVLEGITLDVQPGKCVAVVGATGAGKSTLLSLIPRFYDPQAGRVLIDGIDVRELDLDDLRRNIGLVFQESFLFSTTVAANIAFGHPTATREQIERAAKIAQAHDFIMALPKQYDTILTESGSNLSGGQRQRLAIARALLLEPSILILDDPTAAVDPETEHEIMQAMDNAMQGRTTFVVAHRLSTLRRADLVVVLDRGRIAEVGTHDELMERKGHYRKAARLQIADPESMKLLGLITQ